MGLRVVRLTGVVVAFVALELVSVLGVSAVNPPFPPALSLERAQHLEGATMEHLMQWDMVQHARRGLLGGAQDITGIVQLPVLGSINQYAGSPFLTQVSLGNPAKSFTLLVDTGSSTLWVSCTPCSGCPATPGEQRESYDPSQSWSSSVLEVSDSWCRDSISRGFASSDDSDQQNGRCGYSITYGGGATTTGYYVMDEMHFNATGGNNGSFSSPVVFGCSNLQSGDLTAPNLEFDGIIGIGPREDSINSRLNSIGLVPNVFSLCLKSSSGGNGLLVFGEAVEPGLVYTPLLPSNSYYSLKLEGISVNSNKLSVDPSVFSSPKRQTIADSGTTLTYLVPEAYDPFISAIRAAVAPSVRPVEHGGENCFEALGSLESLFPSVALHFSGGAMMILKPQNYLWQASLSADPLTFCISWKRQESQQLTILGDIVLMDKIIVHDLDNMRFGWVDYDCSQPINITSSSHWKQQRHSNAGHTLYIAWKPIAAAVFLAYILTL